MTNTREDRRPKATLEQVRNDPASLYDADYYSEGYATDSPEAYGRHGEWLAFFENAAAQIKGQLRAETALDVGCAFGLLVEALNDKGIDAYGVDISPYAISQAREDMVERVQVGSILDPLPMNGKTKYDPVICTEVLEHLPPEQANTAVKRLCEAGNRVLFSSSPDDFEEPTHFNVLPTSEWLKLFAAQGFKLSKDVTPDFIAPHAIIVENSQARALPQNRWDRRLKRFLRSKLK